VVISYDYSNARRKFKMVKIVIEIPDELILNIDDIKEQIDYKTREDFIIAAIKRFLDIYNQMLIENS
jgi:metal-responsive CopG/Arc/MetJ family transcriptional regulator